MKKKRLDEILIERGLVKDKNEAFIRVTEGFVLVEGQKAISPAQPFDPGSDIKVKTVSPYVGRGGFKLAGGLKAFSLDLSGKVCLDIGSATGGFTDVMLQNGAAKVYAIDTAWGKLHPKLREDERVVALEKTNILHMSELSEKADFAASDLSLTSLRHLLLVLPKFLKADAEAVLLFKPQYEVAAHEVKHGIVEDEAIRERALQELLQHIEANGWTVLGKATSPIRGAKGNVEYLIHLKMRPLPVATS